MYDEISILIVATEVQLATVVFYCQRLFPAAAKMSFLGISHFPALQRQLSSPPTSTAFMESSPTPSHDLTQDNKDVLIERLNDLVLRLSKDNSVEDSTVSAIHTEVDRIEALLKESDGQHKKSPSAGSDIRTSGEDNFRAPLTPTRSLRMRFPDPPPTRRSVVHEAPMSSEYAIEIAKSAEELALKLSVTVAELQLRREEADVSPYFRWLH